MDLTLSSMQTFVRVVEQGSFAAAARTLEVSPQMVAKHIAMLERRLGARLLNRTTRKQKLTELGFAYYERCQIILAEVAAADALAQEISTLPQGKLRISAPVTFGSRRLVPFISRFLADYPEVEVDLVLTDRLVDLVEEGFEAVFRIGPLADSRRVARPLKPYRLIACAAPAYLARNGVPDTPDELLNHECIGYTYGLPPFNRQWQFTREEKIHVVEVTGRLQVSDSAALLTAALCGHGIVLAPEILLSEAIAAGQLTQILSNFEAPSRPMHLLFNADRHKTAKLRAFIDAVVAEFE
jgi:DNA-binding transcriptional LysR family regulator